MVRPTVSPSSQINKLQSVEALSEYRLRLAGFETRALELQGTGPPLILIHGFSDSADTWRPALDRLAKLNRRAIAIDLPGFGEADRLDPGPILPQYDRFARALARRFGPNGDAIVVGNSLGGLVSMRLAENPAIDLGGHRAGRARRPGHGPLGHDRRARHGAPHPARRPDPASRDRRAGGCCRGLPALRVPPPGPRRPAGGRLLHPPPEQPGRPWPKRCRWPAGWSPSCATPSTSTASTAPS